MDALYLESYSRATPQFRKFSSSKIFHRWLHQQRLKLVIFFYNRKIQQKMIKATKIRRVKCFHAENLYHQKFPELRYIRA